ncbi:hypothetical protein HCC61_17770 [Streptomyces sp. HNM0575]|uniref:hypothetical protein n=1 Tax=Streptomyces sp. HNM0575 TaxID=2716338 RepID=UPI00145CFE2D|nr:hypothetical protein [Streptomyces sp. HNM0575]NLU74503.1 hypothetical protein [Streptomyces sp. HNM0575]
MLNTARCTAAEPESMDQLLGDCARMAPHWTVTGVTGCDVPAAGPAASYEALHGVRVPAASARLLEGMSEYGDW